MNTQILMQKDIHITLGENASCKKANIVST